MPRPRKWRRVCRLPECCRFGPLDTRADEAVKMTVDEYETIRLIDLDGLTQEQCAVSMAVSRTTVQGIYDSARKKLALSVVGGKALLIGGGEYLLCDEKGCEHRGCKQSGGPRGCCKRRLETDGEDREG